MSCARGCCESQAAHYKGVALSPPTPAVLAQRAKDRALNDDMGAYKRLRQNGVQPKNVNGSAQFERKATSEYEIASGRILPDRKSVKLAESVLGDIT